MAEFEKFDPQSPGAVRVRDKQTGEEGYMMRSAGRVQFFPDVASAAEGVGIGEAMMVGAGQATMTAGARLDRLGGAETSAELHQAESLLAPLKAQRPFSTELGQSIPLAGIPGGKAVQAGVGALEGALLRPQNRVGGAVEGAAASLVGGEIGERAFRMFRGMFGGNLGTLAREGLPTTRAQRGQPVAQMIEPGAQAIPLLNRWAAAPARAQQKALNQMAGEALGFSPQVARNIPLNRNGLALAKEAMQVKFRRVSSEIPDTQLPPAITEQIGELNILGKTERAIMDITGALDGDGMMRVRSALNDEVASLAMDGKMPAARGLRITLNAVDELIEQGIDNKATMELWKEARQQWRFLTAIKKGRAISGDGTVNLASARNAINTIYPNFRTGSPLPGRGQRFGELLSALDELPPALQSSGTAERQTAAALLLGGPTVGVLSPEALAAGVAVPTFVTGNLVAQPGARAGAVVERAGVRGSGSPIAEAIAERLDAIDQSPDDESPRRESE